MSLPCIVSGKIVRGNRIGRRLGFPTANIHLSPNDGLKNGVYAVRVQIDGEIKQGVANVGSRPTVTDSPERFLEVFLFDFSGDIYGETIEVELVGFLRPELKFSSVEDLKQQIEQDKIDAELFLKNQRRFL